MPIPPLTPTDVSRLLGRAAFGATAADLDLWSGRDYEDLVEFLLAADPRAPLPDDPRRLLFTTGQDLSSESARIWWMERMRTTPFPLLERMTLLWHGHFATGVRYPPTVAQVLTQNQTLRDHALGNVRAMVEALNVDPAMLYWLNGYENKPPKCNENYAREFFELFTLGKRPQVYTEADIREAAKAFTGWYVDGNNKATFAPARHHNGTKKILGKTVKNLGADEHKAVVGIALAQPASSRFFAYKLVANLAYVPPRKDTLVEAVAATLRKGWDVKAALRTLFLHEQFRTPVPWRGRQLVRTPVETVVHAAKALNVGVDAWLVHAVDDMGQILFDPVNVGGWPLGKDWVTPVTALARYQAGLELFRLANTLPRTAVTLPAPEDLAGWAKRLGVPAFGKNTANAVASYLRRSAAAPVADRKAGVLTLLLSSPEWVVF